MASQKTIIDEFIALIRKLQGYEDIDRKIDKEIQDRGLAGNDLSEADKTKISIIKEFQEKEIECQKKLEGFDLSADELNKLSNKKEIYQVIGKRLADYDISKIDLDGLAKELGTDYKTIIKNSVGQDVVKPILEEYKEKLKSEDLSVEEKGVLEEKLKTLDEIINDDLSSKSQDEIQNEPEDKEIEDKQETENSQDNKRKSLIEKFVKIVVTEIELSQAKKTIDKEKDNRTKEEKIEEEVDIEENSKEEIIEINENPTDKSEALQTLEDSRKIKSFGQFINNMRESAHAHLDNIQSKIDKELEEIKEQQPNKENYKEDDEPER